VCRNPRQDTDLSNAFAELRFDVFVDISLSPDDEPNRSGRHAFIQAGFDEPRADGEHDAAGYQGACIGIGNDAIGFRFAHLDRTHPGYAFCRSADFCFSHISLRFYFRKRHCISIGSDRLTGNRLICSSPHFCGILRRADLTLLFLRWRHLSLWWALFLTNHHQSIMAESRALLSRMLFTIHCCQLVLMSESKDNTFTPRFANYLHA